MISYILHKRIFVVADTGSLPSINWLPGYCYQHSFELGLAPNCSNFAICIKFDKDVSQKLAVLCSCALSRTVN